MPSGDERVNLVLKRFLSQNRMSENFMEYLDGVLTDGLSRIFPTSGLFTYPVTFNFPGVPNGTFSLSPDPIEGIDNAGHVLILEGTDLLNISYEEAISSDYWVAMKYMQIPNDVYANPRTGAPEYDKLLDTVGEVGYASDIDVGGGPIEIELDFILPAGVDHSGRSVRAYLENPLSGDNGVAFEDLAVTYSGGHNIVTASGTFGQGTVSPNPAYYRVACIGVTVRKSVLDPFTAEYVGFGRINVDGFGAPTWFNGDQIDLSGGGGHTLQRAYTGSGSGDGRDIQVNHQAVRLFNQATTTREDDIINAALRIRKDNTTSLYGSGFEWDKGMEVVSRMGSGSAYLARVAIADLSGNDYLHIEEDIDLPGGSNVINFTRGGALDLTFPVGSSGKIWQWFDVVEVIGSALGQDGVYPISAIIASSLQVIEVDGTGITFVAEPGLKARIFRPLFRAGSSPRGLVINGVNDFVDDDTGSGMPFPLCQINVPENTDDTDVLLQIVRDVGGEKLEYSANGNLDVLAGAVSADAVNVGATGLDVDGAGGIDVINGGDIDVTGGGDVNVNTGDINVSSDGNINVLADGNIHVDGTGGIDVTNGGDIDIADGGGISIINGGGIDVANGDIIVTGGGKKVQATQLVANTFVSALGTIGAGYGFQYDAEVDRWKVIPLINSHPPNLGGASSWLWGGVNWHSNSVPGVGEFIYFPIDIPNGSVIKEIQYIINTVDHGTYPMLMEFASFDHKWGAAANTTITTHELDGSTANGWQEESTTVDPTVTVDNSNKSYYVKITSQNANDLITAIRVRYGIQRLVMN